MVILPTQSVPPRPINIKALAIMPILNKKKQKKAQEKRAMTLAQPEPLAEQTDALPEAVETPYELCPESDGCLHCQSAVMAEAPELLAQRQARYAAEGRRSDGTLILSAPEHYPEPSVTRWTPAECQEMVDLWGPDLGAELILMQNEDWSLDDLYGAEMQEAWDAWCSAYRAQSAAREAAEQALINERWQRAVVQQALQEARRTLGRNQRVEKNGRLCTRLYSCVGTKQTGGARPTTLHVSSEGFTHRAFLAGTVKEDCPFAHPGDSSWHAEWMTNCNWRPATQAAEPVRVFNGGSAAQRFSALAGGQRPPQRQGRPAAPAQRQMRGGGAEQMRGGGGALEQFEAAAAWDRF